MSNYVHATGLSAGFFVILAFYMQDPRNLRACAIVSNVLFVTYGAALMLWPILILHLVLLPLNLLRLIQLIIQNKSSRTENQKLQTTIFRHRKWS